MAQYYIPTTNLGRHVALDNVHYIRFCGIKGCTCQTNRTVYRNGGSERNGRSADYYQSLIRGGFLKYYGTSAPAGGLASSIYNKPAPAKRKSRAKYSYYILQKPPGTLGMREVVAYVRVPKAARYYDDPKRTKVLFVDGTHQLGCTAICRQWCENNEKNYGVVKEVPFSEARKMVQRPKTIKKDSRIAVKEAAEVFPKYYKWMDRKNSKVMFLYEVLGPSCGLWYYSNGNIFSGTLGSKQLSSTKFSLWIPITTSEALRIRREEFKNNTAEGSPKFDTLYYTCSTGRFGDDTAYLQFQKHPDNSVHIVNRSGASKKVTHWSFYTLEKYVVQGDYKHISREDAEKLITEPVTRKSAQINLQPDPNKEFSRRLQQLFKDEQCSIEIDPTNKRWYITQLIVHGNRSGWISDDKGDGYATAWDAVEAAESGKRT